MALLIDGVLRRNAEHAPNRLAASLGEASLSHRELERAGNGLALQLRGLGVGHGSRVVCWADTSLDVLPLFAALTQLGAVFAPLNARYGIEEATDVVGFARPTLLVADADHAEAAEVVAKAAGVTRLGRLGGGPGPGLDLSSAAIPPSATRISEPALVETDPHVIFFTSGSTGRPKGVVLSHRANYLRSFQGVFRDDPERTVCMFPLFHMAAFTLAMAAWQTRGEIHFVESATAEQLLRTVERRRANRLYCIPAVWARVLETDPADFDTSSLEEIDTGTSATPPELIEALKQRFPGTVTRIYYGSTECGAAAALPDCDVMRKPGSVGLPPPGVDLRLTQAGEICVRSDYLMDGYFEAEEATAAALVDGWYHSGDLGALDDEGYLSVVGRLREIIRTGGESVAPLEVETSLADHPAVGEVAVVGIPDARWGEVVCAVVVLRAGAALRLEDLQAHCDGRLAGFKKPRRLECVASLPRTAATGQVQRTLLVERIQGQPTTG
jgi:acyl-CoA synthetase (AMP-forming)/AMP-acid ligase II